MTEAGSHLLAEQVKQHPSSLGRRKPLVFLAKNTSLGSYGFPNNLNNTDPICNSGYRMYTLLLFPRALRCKLLEDCFIPFSKREGTGGIVFGVNVD